MASMAVQTTVSMAEHRASKRIVSKTQKRTISSTEQRAVPKAE